MARCPQLEEWLESEAAPPPFDDEGAYLFGGCVRLAYRLSEDDDAPDARTVADQADADLVAAAELLKSLK